MIMDIKFKLKIKIINRNANLHFDEFTFLINHFLKISRSHDTKLSYQHLKP